MKVASRAITLTCSVEGSEGASLLRNKGTVWELGNLSCMLEKKASQWLSSKRTEPRKQSASEDLTTKKCCWYRLLAGDIGKITVPETSISAWFADKSRRWAGWRWFWKLTGSRIESRWLMQDRLAPVSETAVSWELQTSRFTKTLFLSMTKIRTAGSLERHKGSTAQSPRSCAGCFSLKVGTDCSNPVKNLPRSQI